MFALTRLTVPSLFLAAFTTLTTQGHAAPMDGVPNTRVVDTICRTPFGGPFASVRVFRYDSVGGPVGRYQLIGDLMRFSHPPSTIFDAQGAELLVIPERPITPGSDEARELERRRNAALAGAVPAETLSCAAPSRPIHALPARAQARSTIEGTVVRRYHCEPCGPKAPCAPCLRDHLVLSEQATLPDDAPLGATEVLVWSWEPLPPELVFGRRARLRVATSTTPQTATNPTPDVEFLAVEHAPEQ